MIRNINANGHRLQTSDEVMSRSIGSNLAAKFEILWNFFGKNQNLPGLEEVYEKLAEIDKETDLVISPEVDAHSTYFVWNKVTNYETHFAQEILEKKMRDRFNELSDMPIKELIHLILEKEFHQDGTISNKEK